MFSRLEHSSGHGMWNPFQELGLMVTYCVPLQTLETAYFEAQRRWHPDRFIHASLEDKQEALMHAGRVNQAYQDLKNPVKRAEILLLLYGVGDLHQPVAPDVALDAFEWRQRLEEACEHRGNIENLKSEAQARYQEIQRCFEMFDSSLCPVDQARSLFQSMAFFAKFIRMCEDQLLSLMVALD